MISLSLAKRSCVLHASLLRTNDINLKPKLSAIVESLELDQNGIIADTAQVVCLSAH